MNNLKISIIVPIYNTEKYLKKCIDSIANQTYRNLEIILVDDGSTDTSGEIVDEYAKADARMIAVHKENGGEADARNAGLRVATGEYVGFVDSDDWIEKDMYQCLVETMAGEKLDMVIGGYFFDRENQAEQAVNEQPVTKEEFNREQLLDYVFQRDSYRGVAAYSWNKIFRREMLLCTGAYVAYDTKYKIGTDVLWFAHVALKSERIKYIDKALYHYVQRNESAVHSQNLSKQIQRIEVYQKVIELFQDSAVKEETITYVKRFLAYHAMNIAKMAWNQEDYEVYEEMRMWMLHFRKEYRATNIQYPERVEEFEEICQRSKR